MTTTCALAMKHTIAGLATVALVAISPQALAQTVGPLASILPSEFLKLPDGVKAVYVGGVLDGMTFTSYNYSLSHHDQHVRCARTLTLGALAQKTADGIRARRSGDEDMATAVAMALGAHCKEKGLR